MIYFGHIHPRQVKNMINCLTKARNELDDEIKRLQAAHDSSQKVDQTQKARDKLMRDLISENVTPAEAEKRLIDMGYQHHRVREAQHLLRLSAKRKRRVLRNQEIVRRYMVNNESPADLSKEYGISRVQVHRIIQEQHIGV